MSRGPPGDSCGTEPSSSERERRLQGQRRPASKLSAVEEQLLFDNRSRGNGKWCRDHNRRIRAVRDENNYPIFVSATT
jgi:hypothetical protein